MFHSLYAVRHIRWNWMMWMMVHPSHRPHRRLFTVIHPQISRLSLVTKWMPYLPLRNTSFVRLCGVCSLLPLGHIKPEPFMQLHSKKEMLSSVKDRSKLGQKGLRFADIYVNFGVTTTTTDAGDIRELNHSFEESWLLFNCS